MFALKLERGIISGKDAAKNAFLPSLGRDPMV
jgi:hypothetical protein